MGSHPDDILVRLQATIETWANEVTEAHDDLTRQITESKDQLSTLVRVLAARNQGSQQALKTYEETEALKKSLAEQESALDEQRESTGTLREHIADLQRERDALLERDAKRQDELQSMSMSLAEARTRQESAEAEAGRIAQELSDARDMLRERDETLRGAVENTATLAKSFEEIQTEIRQWREASSSADETRAALENELAALRAAVEQGEPASGEDAALHARLDEAESALARELDARTALEGERDSLQARLAELEARTEDAIEGASESQSLREALQAAEQRIEAMQGTLDERDRDMEELRAAVAEAESRVTEGASSQAETSTLQNRIASMDETIEAERARVETLTTERRRLEEELGAQTAALEEARNAAERALETAETAQQEVEALRTAATDARQELDAAQRESATAGEKVAELEAALAEAKAEAASAGELAALKARAEEAQRETQALREELARLQEQEAASAQTLDELREQAEALEAKANRADELESERDALDERVRSLEDELASQEPPSPHAGADTFSDAVEHASADRGILELRAELLTVEAFLLEREGLIETTTRHVDRLDETITGLERDLARVEESEAPVPPAFEEVHRLVTQLEEDRAALKKSAYEIFDDERKRLTLRSFDQPERAERMASLLRDCGVLSEAQCDEATTAARQGAERPLAKTLLDHAIDPMEAVRAVIDYRSRAQASTAEARLSELEAALAEAHADLHTAQQELESARQRLDEREKEIASRESKMAEQEDTLEQFQADLQSVMSKQQDDEQSAGHLNSMLEEAKAQIDALNETIAAREEEMERLRHESDDGAPTPSEDETERRIQQAAFDAQGRRRTMGEILVNAGVITETQLGSALEEQKTSKRKRIGSILVEKGFIREEIIAQVLASQLKLQFIRLDPETVESEAIALIDGHHATHHMCMPIRREENTLLLAMANPLDLIAIEDIELMTDLEVQPVVATLADITSAVVRCYGALSSNLDDAPPKAT